jgi:hypothetical protein
MADQTNIISLNPNTFSSEVYSSVDASLITSLNEDNTYDLTSDYVEFFVYSLNNSIVAPFGNDGTFTNYRVIDNELYIDPETDTIRAGVSTGTVNTLYNFYRKRLSSSPQSTYYIKEISSDRTEIRLDSNIISREDIITSTNEFISYREQDQTFPDFYLNFGSNTLLIANNIMLADDNTVLIKLYEPLPQNITLKSSLWVVEKISNGLAFRVEFPTIVELFQTLNPTIQGPNFNLANKDELNNPTEEVTLNSFTSPNSQSASQIGSYFDDPSVNISVDYTDFNEFVNFSSAKSRIENFWYKVSLIESASAQIAIQSAATSTTYTSSSLAPLNNLINSTITNFDKYEYYLYFESSSDTYPKTNLEPPYENVSTGSVAALSWYDNKLIAAENYDEFNQNWLKFAIPEYIRDDANNNQYMEFVNMVGQFVDDNIWVYVKDTTNKWDADNRINAGVSKDLVAQVLRDMGVKLYQNNFSSTDLYSAFLGFTDSGSLFPFPYMTGSVESAPGILDTPDGYEYITNFISSSDEAIPLDDINKRIYKRIYHNLPYLLKSKGTVAGLRTLINSYGIPDTILRISEFGGKDRNNVNDWDLWKHQYNYAYQMQNTSYISSSWYLEPAWGSQAFKPESLQFRFNAGLYSGSNGIAEASQSLWTVTEKAGGVPIPQGCAIVLEYDTDLAEIPTADTYSGSILDPEYQYATLKFTVDDFVTSASVQLPFFDNGWWSVQVDRTSPLTWELRVGNKIYSGSDGSQIGFIASSSLSSGNSSGWDNNDVSWFSSQNGNGLTLSTGNYENFNGKYQEIRYFNQPLTDAIFKDYVMNPQSTEGNGVNGSYNQLAFRGTLGGELYTGSFSTHPKVSGSYVTESFRVGGSQQSDFVINEGEFVKNREWVFYDSPAVGIKNRNTDKIKQQNLILPSGDTLSGLRSIQQSSYDSESYTNNLNLLEVAFSPQNQINDDIISQIGYFNIGDYIGDPRLVSSSADTYPSLVELSKQYFEKYTSSYDVYDYIRLIKFFDNSLFKMIKDYVPARTGLASGIVVKQHILERQKYPTPQAEWTQPEYTGSIGSTPALLSGSKYYIATTDYESIPVETVTGSDGGALPVFVEGTNYTEYTYPGAINVTQSWSGINVTKVGDISFTQDDATEFINGEFSGSEYIVTNGELNSECDHIKEASTEVIGYDIQHFTNNDNGQFYFPNFQAHLSIFLSDAIIGGIPVPAGGINLWWNSSRVIDIETFPITYYDTYKVEYIKISKTSTNSIDLENYIPNSHKIVIPSITVNDSMVSTTGWTYGTYVSLFGNGGNYIELDILNISEKDNYYLLQVIQSDGYNFTITSQGTGLDALSTPAPVTASIDLNTQTILEPYIDGNFEISDCNPLINNAPVNRLSNVYYDVDYSQNSILPVNFNTIMSGSAVKAELQDYNYFARRSTIPRYEGSKNGTTTEYSVTNASIDATQAYFAYFNWVGGTSPEWGNGLEDRTGVNVRFFVDENGTIIKPIADSQGINQGIVEQNFTEGKIATLAFDDSTGASAAFSNLLGDHTIFKSGKTIAPICYSQTASIAADATGGYASTLSFVQGDQQQSSAADNRLTSNTTALQTIVTTGPVVYAVNTLLGANAQINIPAPGQWSYEIKPAGFSPTAQGITLNFTATLKRSGAAVAKVVTVQFYKNGNPVGTSKQFDFSGYYNSLDISYSDSTAIPGDEYNLRVTSISGDGILILSTDSYFRVTQTPPPNIGTASIPYWSKSSNTLILSGLANFYGQKQEDIANTGFFTITNDFELQIGDEIRFDGTETQTYTVLEVTNANPPQFVLDRSITASNLNWFLVRRYIDDPANIILEVDKTAGGTSPGVLKPQYLSRRVENNLDTILEKLRTDQLI